MVMVSQIILTMMMMEMEFLILMKVYMDQFDSQGIVYLYMKLNRIDVSNNASQGDDDGDGIPDHLDNDDDGDGIPDEEEGTL